MAEDMEFGSIIEEIAQQYVPTGGRSGVSVGKKINEKMQKLADECKEIYKSLDKGQNIHFIKNPHRKFPVKPVEQRTYIPNGIVANAVCTAMDDMGIPEKKRYYTDFEMVEPDSKSKARRYEQCLQTTSHVKWEADCVQEALKFMIDVWSINENDVKPGLARKRGIYRHNGGVRKKLKLPIPTSEFFSRVSVNQLTNPGVFYDRLGKKKDAKDAALAAIEKMTSNLRGRFERGEEPVLTDFPSGFYNAFTRESIQKAANLDIMKARLIQCEPLDSHLISKGLFMALNDWINHRADESLIGISIWGGKIHELALELEDVVITEEMEKMGFTKEDVILWHQDSDVSAFDHKVDAYSIRMHGAWCLAQYDFEDADPFVAFFWRHAINWSNYYFTHTPLVTDIGCVLQMTGSVASGYFTTAMTDTWVHVLIKMAFYFKVKKDVMDARDAELISPNRRDSMLNYYEKVLYALEEGGYWFVCYGDDTRSKIWAILKPYLGHEEMSKFYMEYFSMKIKEKTAAGEDGSHEDVDITKTTLLKRVWFKDTKNQIWYTTKNEPDFYPKLFHNKHGEDIDNQLLTKVMLLLDSCGTDSTTGGLIIASIIALIRAGAVVKDGFQYISQIYPDLKSWDDLAVIFSEDTDKILETIKSWCTPGVEKPKKDKKRKLDSLDFGIMNKIAREGNASSIRSVMRGLLSRSSTTGSDDVISSRFGRSRASALSRLETLEGVESLESTAHRLTNKLMSELYEKKDMFKPRKRASPEVDDSGFGLDD